MTHFLKDSGGQCRLAESPMTLPNPALFPSSQSLGEDSSADFPELIQRFSEIVIQFITRQQNKRVGVQALTQIKRLRMPRCMYVTHCGLFRLQSFYSEHESAKPRSSLDFTDVDFDFSNHMPFLDKSASSDASPIRPHRSPAQSGPSAPPPHQSNPTFRYVQQTADNLSYPNGQTSPYLSPLSLAPLLFLLTLTASSSSTSQLSSSLLAFVLKL